MCVLFLKEMLRVNLKGWCAIMSDLLVATERDLEFVDAMFNFEGIDVEEDTVMSFEEYCAEVEGIAYPNFFPEEERETIHERYEAYIETLSNV